MKIIFVKEEDHGFLFVAKNTRSAVINLIDLGWIHENTEVWDNNSGELVPINYLYSFNEIKKMTLEDLNKAFDGLFTFTEEELIEKY